MKKIFALTVTCIFFAATNAFASCPINPTNNSCSINPNEKITGAAAPVSYIISPAQQNTTVPPCKNCNIQQKQSKYQKAIKPVSGIYDALFAPFTNLYE